jgi:2'-5' RNA ligase
VRLFIAVDPSPDAVAHLGDVVEGLRVSAANAPGRSTRLTRRENWHITLAFLGDVPATRMDVAAAVMQEVAAQATPLWLRVAGGGIFGGRRDPILWAGIGGEIDGLRRLARLLQRAVRRARLPVDERPPRPHLTISRPGQRVSAEDLDADVAALSAYEGPQWILSTVRLLRSDIEQTPTGPTPQYTAVATAPLGGHPGPAGGLAGERS